MNKRPLITSLIAGSLILGSSAAALADQKTRCDSDSKREQQMDRRFEKMSDALKLSPDQQTAIKALWQGAQPEHAAQQRPEELQKLDPNANDYAQQVQQHIAQAQQQLAQRMQARANHKAALYEILTPEQEQALEQMRERHGEHRDQHPDRHHGPRPL